jgi:hypothetical protein
MLSKFRRDLDPLDLELLERACVAVKENDSRNDLDSDEALEATLRRELIEIACSNGVSDAETLRDIENWMRLGHSKSGLLAADGACLDVLSPHVTFLKSRTPKWIAGNSPLKSETEFRP